MYAQIDVNKYNYLLCSTQYVSFNSCQKKINKKVYYSYIFSARKRMMQKLNDEDIPANQIVQSLDTRTLTV